jgi:hypothetical protein
MKPRTPRGPFDASVLTSRQQKLEYTEFNGNNTHFHRFHSNPYYPTELLMHNTNGQQNLQYLNDGNDIIFTWYHSATGKDKFIICLLKNVPIIGRATTGKISPLPTSQRILEHLLSK